MFLFGEGLLLFIYVSERLSYVMITAYLHLHAPQLGQLLTSVDMESSSRRLSRDAEYKFHESIQY